MRVLRHQISILIGPVTDIVCALPYVKKNKMTVDNLESKTAFGTPVRQTGTHGR